MKKFLDRALSEQLIKEYVTRTLHSAGVSSVVVQHSPIATRIAVYAKRPQAVVGKAGRQLRELEEGLRRLFGVESPQIQVIEIETPELDANLMAQRIARQLERRANPKPLARFALMDILAAGAVGAEIRIAGKLGAKGAKAKIYIVREGFLKKSGEYEDVVRVGYATARPRAGSIGVIVRIVPPGVVLERALPRVKAALAAPLEVPEAGEEGRCEGGETGKVGEAG